MERGRLPLPRCATCGRVWADIAADDYATRRHNARDDEELTAQAEDFYGRARERVHAEFLRGVAGRPPGRWLDVGYFLHRAQDAGWSVRGCDTSAAWVRMANERLGEQVTVVAVRAGR